MLLGAWLYGIYVVLFASCVYSLWWTRLKRRRLLAAIAVLFMLATADVVLTVHFFFRTALRVVAVVVAPSVRSGSSESAEPWDRTLEYKFGLYIFAHAIASGLLIHRCHEVWGNKRILIAPIVLVVVGTAISFVSIATSSMGDRLLAASFITSAAANISLTVLIAVRMWWITRKARSIGEVRMSLLSIVTFIGSLLVDSGAGFSLAIFFYLFFHTLVIDTSLTQIAGMSATAMVMRNSWREPRLHDSTIGTGAITTASTFMARQRVVAPPAAHIDADRRSIISAVGASFSDSISIDSDEFK